MSSRWRQVVSNAAKTLGSLGNKPEKRLSECLPPADRAICDRDGQLKHYKGAHAFPSDYARNHFIKAILILLSENGKNDLNNLSFDNFYSRAYDEEGKVWYTASIVAMDDFSIRHTLLAPNAATTKAAAFHLLTLEVETRIGALLRSNSGAPNDQSSTSPKTQVLQSAISSHESGEQGTTKTDGSVYSKSTAGSPVELIPPLVFNSAANLAVSQSAVRRSFTLRY